TGLAADTLCDDPANARSWEPSETLQPPDAVGLPGDDLRACSGRSQWRYSAGVGHKFEAICLCVDRVVNGNTGIQKIDSGLRCNQVERNILHFLIRRRPAPNINLAGAVDRNVDRGRFGPDRCDVAGREPEMRRFGVALHGSNEPNRDNTQYAADHDRNVDNLEEMLTLVKLYDTPRSTNGYPP